MVLKTAAKHILTDLRKSDQTGCFGLPANLTAPVFVG
jgi:hypothetical protein